MSLTFCRCSTANKNSGNGCDAYDVEFEGAVLATFEVNGYDDSDFVAVVWDGEKITHREYASTRGWTYHNHASVDATDEVEELALAWYREFWAKNREIELRRRATEVAMFQTVRSTTKRGKNVGVVGVVKWEGESYGEKRFGIEVEGERGYRFLPGRSLEVVDPVDPEIFLADIARQAQVVRPANWISVFA